MCDVLVLLGMATTPDFEKQRRLKCAENLSRLHSLDLHCPMMEAVVRGGQVEQADDAQVTTNRPSDVSYVPSEGLSNTDSGDESEPDSLATCKRGQHPTMASKRIKGVLQGYSLLRYCMQFSYLTRIPDVQSNVRKGMWRWRA
jgi:hypothetical protein